MYSKLQVTIATGLLFLVGCHLVFSRWWNEPDQVVNFALLYVLTHRNPWSRCTASLRVRHLDEKQEPLKHDVWVKGQGLVKSEARVFKGKSLVRHWVQPVWGANKQNSPVRKSRCCGLSSFCMWDRGIPKVAVGESVNPPSISHTGSKRGVMSLCIHKG